MKLVQLLARELREWPDSGTDVVGQAADGSLHLNASTENNRGFTEEVYGLAEDWSTQDVTRPQWEAEKARIAGKETWLRHRGRKCPVQSGTLVDLKLRGGVIHRGKFCDNHAWIHTGKPFDVMYYRLSEPEEQLAPVSEEAIQDGIDAADAGKLTPIDEVKARFSSEEKRIERDGWIRNHGKDCPVDIGELVEVMHRDGCMYSGVKAGEGMAANWGISNHPEDIIWYRPDFEVYPPSYKARQALAEAKQIRGECEDYDPQPVSRDLLAKSIAHCQPYEWRDRIRELDTQRAELEATYQRQIGEIDGERASLVGKLAQEGLALVEVQVQPVEAVDWREWREGDMVEVVDAGGWGAPCRLSSAYLPG